MPEFNKKGYRSILRSIENESFAVSTLLFMIMLPGKTPYAQQGGEDQAENIKKMEFPYPYGSNTTGKAPNGPWRFIWSHLIFALKKAFYDTFHKDGEHSSPSNRLSDSDWLQIFRRYLLRLQDGTMAANDVMSLELFPTRHKKDFNETYVFCLACGMEVTEKFTHDGICRECQHEGEVYKCKGCGKEIVYSRYMQYFNIKRNEYCSSNCYKQVVYCNLVCQECGVKFPFTNGEKDFYQKMKYFLPKRCKKCRNRHNHI